MPLSNAQHDKLKDIRKRQRIAANNKKNSPKVKKRGGYVRKTTKSKNKQQYKTKEWLELRDRIVTRDNNRCVACGKEAKVLHVHHLLYERGKEIWEVPDYYLVTLCPGCHVKEHSLYLSHPRKRF